MSGLSALQQYQRVTANYWAFTLTDGALRMLVVFTSISWATPAWRLPFSFSSMSSLGS